jgi:hypothetical protein
VTLVTRAAIASGVHQPGLRCDVPIRACAPMMRRE